jgi:hypothetical protein
MTMQITTATSRGSRPSRGVVEKAIRDSGGNISRAAGLLGSSRQSLYTWIYQYDLVRLAGVVPLETAPTAPLPSDGDATRLLSVSKVPVGLHRWVRGHAVMTDRSASAVVIEALELLRAVVEGARSIE